MKCKLLTESWVLVHCNIYDPIIHSYWVLTIFAKWVKPSFHKYHWAPDTEQIVNRPSPVCWHFINHCWLFRCGAQHIKTKTCPRYYPGHHCPCLDVCELPVVDAGLRAVQAEVQVQPVLSNPDCLQLRVTVQPLMNPETNYYYTYSGFEVNMELSKLYIWIITW